MNYRQFLWLWLEVRLSIELSVYILGFLKEMHWEPWFYLKSWIHCLQLVHCTSRGLIWLFDCPNLEIFTRGQQISYERNGLCEVIEDYSFLFQDYLDHGHLSYPHDSLNWLQIKQLDHFTCYKVQIRTQNSKRYREDY